MHVQGMHSIMFQDFGVGFPMGQINPILSPLGFSTSFSEACHVVLGIVNGLLVKAGQNRSYIL